MKNDKQYTILLEAIRKVGQRIDDLEKVTNEIKKDIGDDRIKIDDVVLAQSKLSDTIQMMRGDTNDLSKKTEAVVKDAMTDVMQPAVKSVENLRKEIKGKDTIIISKSRFVDWVKLRLRGKNVKNKSS
jgi:hypothetical protein